MDRLYVGLLIGFVLGVWISFIVVVMVSGDESVTNRLIGYERQRSPHAPLAVWIQNAIDRLVHDRH